jgi:LTXXQ motif family protein
MIMRNSARRFVALSGMLLAIGTAAGAQELPKSVPDLEKQIGLTDAQRKKMEAVDKKYQPKFEALNKKYQPQFMAIQKKIAPLQKQGIQLRDKMNAEGKPTFDAMNKEKEAVLSPDQVKKMKAILAKLAAQAKQGNKK